MNGRVWDPEQVRKNREQNRFEACLSLQCYQPTELNFKQGKRCNEQVVSRNQ